MFNVLIYLFLHVSAGLPTAYSHPSGRRRRFPSDFTYISSCVKYSMFFFNFLFWLLGALLVAVGLYALFDKWTSGEGFKLDNVIDILFNLAFVLVIVGAIVFIVRLSFNRVKILVILRLDGKPFWRTKAEPFKMCIVR